MLLLFLLWVSAALATPCGINSVRGSAVNMAYSTCCESAKQNANLKCWNRACIGCCRWTACDRWCKFGTYVCMCGITGWRCSTPENEPERVVRTVVLRTPNWKDEFMRDKVGAVRLKKWCGGMNTRHCYGCNGRSFPSCMHKCCFPSSRMFSLERCIVNCNRATYFVNGAEQVRYLPSTTTTYGWCWCYGEVGVSLLQSNV